VGFRRALPYVGGIGKRVVYILRNPRDPSRHYVVITEALDRRLEWHNPGLTGFTILQRANLIVQMFAWVKWLVTYSVRPSGDSAAPQGPRVRPASL
jgi:hypothetical protein